MIKAELELEKRIRNHIREIKDFPVSGINFKDITPVLAMPKLCEEIVIKLASFCEDSAVDAIAGIEARGFIFGSMIAQKMKLPFVPIRKSGKLPYDKIQVDYGLEYGKSTIEMHSDAVKKGWNVIVHDDLLATGGTAEAAAKMIEELGASVHSFSFLVELDFLKGRKILEPFCNSHVHSILNYDK